MTTARSFFLDLATHDNGGEVPLATRIGVLERFAAKIGIHNSSEECWLWTASRSHDGYGKFWDGDRLVYAHRFAYEVAIGAIPDGLVLDHVEARGCRNRHCVNPDHLEAVTQRENLLRGDTIQAANAAKTECPQGHPLFGGNLFVDSRGSRSCRTCRRERSKAVVS